MKDIFHMNNLETFFQSTSPQPPLELEGRLWGKVERNFVSQQNGNWTFWKKIMIGSFITLSICLFLTVKIIKFREATAPLIPLENDLNSFEQDIVVDPEMDQILQIKQ